MYYFRFIALFVAISVLFSQPIYAEGTEKPERVVLDNGLVVVFKEVHTAPLVAVQLWVKTGSIHEGEYLGSGISHLIEHMLFKGTKRRGVGEIGRQVSASGGEMGGYTSMDRTVYHMVMPRDKAEIALDILADAAANATFDPAEMEKEKEVILREMDMCDDDPDKYLSRKIWQEAFSQHPYQYPVIGYKGIFAQLTQDDLLKYYQRFYVPNNMILSVAGDFNSFQMLENINKYFKDFKRTSISPVYLPQEPAQIGKRMFEDVKDIKAAYLEMAFHIPDIRSRDLYPLDVMALILGQGNSSRLYQTLREKENIVYSINAWSYTPQYPGLFGITAVLEHENLQKAQDSIWKEVERLTQGDITDEELEKARQMVIASSIFSQETVESQAADIASNEYVCGNINFNKDYVEGVRKVTEDDIIRVAKQYLCENNLTLGILKPKIKKDTISPSIQVKVEPIIQKFVYDNGLVLLVLEDDSLPIVSVNAVFKGGVLFEEKGREGVCNLVQKMMLKGTKNRNAKQIAEEIESRGGDISAYGGNNSFGCSFKVLKEDLDLGLSLLSDVLLNPSFPAEEMEKERKAVMAAIRLQDDDPFNYAVRILRENMWQDHPYRHNSLGTEEAVNGLKYEDLSAFHQAFCQPGNMVLSVFGDVKAQEIRQKVSETWAGVKGCKLSSSFPEKAEQKESRQVIQEKDKEQSIILLGFPGVRVGDPDKYVFDVMSSILSGKGSRLFVNLRDKYGLAYYVGVFSMLGLSPGAYVFYIGTGKDRIDAALEGIKKEVTILKGEDVTDEELSRAKASLIGEHWQSMQTNSAHSFNCALNELYGLGYEEVGMFLTRINGVTKDDIKRVANKYLQDDKCTVVIVRSKVMKF
ncbi:MAG: pitrilysin family protein [bacterium]|nr:pitrilysin family protein [bacterium]